MSFLEAARWSPHCGCRQRGTEREGCLILQGASSQMAVNSFGEMLGVGGFLPENSLF